MLGVHSSSMLLVLVEKPLRLVGVPCPGSVGEEDWDIFVKTGKNTDEIKYIKQYNNNNVPKLNLTESIFERKYCLLPLWYSVIPPLFKQQSSLCDTHLNHAKNGVTKFTIW